MISKYIKTIGLELECGINRKEKRLLSDFARKYNAEQEKKAEKNAELKALNKKIVMGGDGSLRNIDKENPCEEYKFHSEDFEELLKIAKFIYKKCKIEVNDSCGLHIHITADPKLYGLFSYKYFYENFMDAYKSKFNNKNKYMVRLNNHYCKDGYSEYNVYEQLQTFDKPDARYNAINLNAYNRYGTIEFRIMPYQENFTELKKSLSWFIKTIDRVLTKTLKKKVIKQKKINIHSYQGIKIDLADPQRIRKLNIDSISNKIRPELSKTTYYFSRFIREKRNYEQYRNSEEPEQEDLCNCNVCGATINRDDVYNCENCNNDVCESCIISGLNDSYCENCYNDMSRADQRRFMGEEEPETEQTGG